MKMVGPLTLSFNSDGSANTAATQSGAMASTNTIYTVPVDVGQYGAWSAQFIWSTGGAAPTGTLTAEFSLDGTTWTDSGLTFTAISGATGSRLLDTTKTGVRLFRFKYVNATNSATATGKFYGKAE